jgi:hypothetical protein
MDAVPILLSDECASQSASLATQVNIQAFPLSLCASFSFAALTDTKKLSLKM